MEKFKNDPNKFKEFRNMVLLKTIPLSLIALGGAAVIINYNSAQQQTESTNWLFLAPFIIGPMLFGMYISLKKQKEFFESYELVIDDIGITRIQANTSTIRIPKSEIREITKNSNGSFSIKGDSLLNMIGVPAQIENYERLELALSKIKELSVKTNEPFLQKFQWLISVVSISLMAAVYISNNKIVVGISGTAMLALLGYSFFVIQKSKNIDSTIKKTIWFSLLIAGSIIAIMYYKLIA